MNGWVSRADYFAWIPYVFLLVLLVAAFVTDIKKRIIPNRFTVTGVVAGHVFHTVCNGTAGLKHSAMGFVVGFGLMFALYVFGAVGAGDVKLFAAIGAIAGTRFVLISSTYSIVFAGVIGLIIAVFRKEAWGRVRGVIQRMLFFAAFRQRDALVSGKEQHLRFPFMYAVLPGAISALFDIYYWLEV